MEGRSELALLAYAKLQLSFAAAAAAVAEWERGEKGEIGNGGRRATSSVTLASRICITEEQAGKAIDARIASHYMPIHSEPEGDYL